MAAGRSDGWAQRWHNRNPTWCHVSQGGFDRRRYEVVELPNAPARAYIKANHYLTGWPSARYRFGLLDLEAAPVDGDQVVDGRPLVGVVVLGVPMSRDSLTNVFPSLAPSAHRFIASIHWYRSSSSAL